MTPPTEIICDVCGYATGEPVGEDGINHKVGRCCVDLPRPYQFDDKTGLYAAVVPGRTTRVDEDGEAEDEEGDCDCWDCRFVNGRLEDDEVSELITTGERDDLADYGDVAPPRQYERIRAYLDQQHDAE